LELLLNLGECYLVGSGWLSLPEDSIGHLTVFDGLITVPKFQGDGPEGTRLTPTPLVRRVNGLYKRDEG